MQRGSRTIATARPGILATSDRNRWRRNKCRRRCLILTQIRGHLREEEESATDVAQMRREYSVSEDVDLCALHFIIGRTER